MPNLEPLKPALLFVHGTGDRLANAAPFYAQLEGQLQHFQIHCTLTPIVWGDVLGVEFEGKSLPNPPVDPGGDPENSSEWSFLAADPLFGLKLLALPDTSVPGTAGGAMGTRPKWEIAWQTVKAYRVSDDLSHLLTRAALGGLWDTASGEILGQPVTRQAFLSSGDNTAEPTQALARAIVAQLLALAAADGSRTPVSNALRDKLYDRLVYDWGADVRSIGGRIASFLTGLAREHRPTWSSAASLKIGDILLYQVRGQEIRDFIASKIAKSGRPVILIAHSLGGIACVDLLAGPNPPKVAGLITLGSQAPLFFEFGALGSMRGKTDLPDSFPPWLNFYDRNDFLSYVGERLFTKVRDFEINSGLPFPASHSGYFSCEETWVEIKKFMDRICTQ